LSLALGALADGAERLAPGLFLFAFAVFRMERLPNNSPSLQTLRLPDDLDVSVAIMDCEKEAAMHEPGSLAAASRIAEFALNITALKGRYQVPSQPGRLPGCRHSLTRLKRRPRDPLPWYRRVALFDKARLTHA
jgi:hypothetical protein